MYDISAAAHISSLFYRLSGASDDDNATAQLELSPGRIVHFQMERDRYFRKPVPSSAQAITWLQSSENQLRWDVASYLNEHVIHEWNLGAELDLCKFKKA